MNWVLIWLGVVILAAIAEAATTQLVALWFAIAGVITMISAYFGLDTMWQIILFLVLSVILLLSTRPVIKRVLTPKLQATNADRLIGMECVITEDIDNIIGKGSARVHGQDWTARSVNDDVKLFKGEKAVIRQISGVKLIVECKKEQ